MQVKDAIVAGALLNAELMGQRDEALTRLEEALARIAELEAEQADKGEPEKAVAAP